MPNDIVLDHPATLRVAPGETLAGSITLLTDSATIQNSGLISGPILLRTYGTFFIDNYAGAVIRAGTPIGQYFPGTLTLTNGGTILGQSGTAIDLAWLGDNLIRVLPGGSFVGQVNSPGTLELAAGGGSGMIDRLGTRFTGFSDIVIDAGADWSVGNASTIGTGTRLTNAGRLTETGTLAVLGDFGGNGTLALARSATVAIAGTLGASRVVFGAGGGQLLRLGNPQGFAGRIDGFKAGETIDLGGIGAASLTGFAGGRATLAGPGGTISLRLSGSFDPAGFFTVPDGSGGILLTYGAPAELPGAKTIAAGALYASGYTATVGTLVNHGGIAGPGLAGGPALPLHLDNDGTIAGSANGVFLPIGGSLANKPGGVIRGGAGIYAPTTTATVSNAGFIGGTVSAGISLAAGGRVDNLAGGTISGDVGFANAAITLTNAGYVHGRVVENDFGNPDVASITGIRITNLAGGTITGGVLADAPGVVLDNAGVLGSSYAYFRLRNGGTLVNRAAGTLRATSVRASGPLTLLNEGWIDAHVFTTDGGTVVNGGTMAGTGFSQERLQGTETNITNFGFIDGVAITRSLLVNAVGGTIGHYSNGGVTELASTIVNAGLIVESPYPGAQATSEMVGAKLVGGRMDNRATGTIQGYTGVVANYGATVVNAGTIIGSGGTAVSFAPSNGSPNRLEIAPGAVFVGVADGGFARQGTSPSTLGLIGVGGTLAGFGSSFVRFPHVDLAADASWTLGDATLPAWATFANAGTLVVPAALYSRATISGGLSLASGATLTNAAGGVITAAGTAVSGAGDRVTNLAGGTIRGRVGIRDSQPGAIVNAGTIAGTAAGVLLAAGGSVQNRAGGTISGAGGIRVIAGATTIVNAGSIAAPNSSAPAIRFADADGNRLVVLPGSAITGQVQGGAASDTLELGSGLGTIAWIGAHYTGFETLAVQSGGQWRMTGLNTLAGNGTLAISAGSTLAVAGTLRVTGDVGMARLGNLTALPTGAVVVGGAPASAGAVTVSAGQHIAGIGALKAATIIDAGTITAAGGALRLLGNVAGPGTVAIAAQSIMAVYGTLGLPRITFLPGDHQTLLLGNPAAVSATIDGFGATDVINLPGAGLATSTSFTDDTLTIALPSGAISLHFAGPYQASQFAIADDGHGGTSLTYS